VGGGGRTKGAYLLKRGVKSLVNKKGELKTVHWGMEEGTKNSFLTRKSRGWLRERVRVGRGRTPFEQKKVARFISKTRV